MHIFITGTDTNVGKTLIASWLCLHTNYAYYKPIQTGCTAQDKDSDRALVHEYSKAVTFPETWVHPMPAAPWVIEETTGSCAPKVHDFRIPTIPNLIIEGAGGVLVPLNAEELLVDLISHIKAPVILVARPDLGTINHTLLSIEALRARNIPVLGVIMNRPCTPGVAKSIHVHGKIPILATFPELLEVSYAALRGVPLNDTLRKIFSMHLTP